MPAEVSDNIPGVDNEQLAAVAGLLPELPNIRVEPADRFAQAVRSLVEKRAQNAWPNEGDADLAVFVMVDHPRRIGQKYETDPFLDLSGQDTSLLGHLFFANGDASSGRYMSIPTDPNAILEWIADQDLGGCPIVIVYRKSKLMVTRRAGIDDYATEDSIRDYEPCATLPELEKALKHYHQTGLLTPACCPDGVWEPGRAGRYVPGPHPERSIQSALVIALGSWFRGVVRAESEVTTNIGRIDVQLLKKNENGLACWIIIELKIIKSFRNAQEGFEPSRISEADNVSAIVEGVKQAEAYRKIQQAEEGLLEIYDLRKSKTDDLTKQERVSDAQKKFMPHPPKIHMWPVFGSAQDARNAGYAGV